MLFPGRLGAARGKQFTKEKGPADIAQTEFQSLFQFDKTMESKEELERVFRVIQVCRGLGAFVALGAISTLTVRWENGLLPSPLLPIDWIAVTVNILSFLSPYIVRDMDSLYEYRPAVRFPYYIHRHSL